MNNQQQQQMGSNSMGELPANLKNIDQKLIEIIQSEVKSLEYKFFFRFSKYRVRI